MYRDSVMPDSWRTRYYRLSFAKDDSEPPSRTATYVIDGTNEEED
jgi:hypothetical protein